MVKDNFTKGKKTELRSKDTRVQNNYTTVNWTDSDQMENLDRERRQEIDPQMREMLCQLVSQCYKKRFLKVIKER